VDPHGPFPNAGKENDGAQAQVSHPHMWHSMRRNVIAAAVRVVDGYLDVCMWRVLPGIRARWLDLMMLCESCSIIYV
jgi:hypothetical protein